MVYQTNIIRTPSSSLEVGSDFSFICLYSNDRSISAVLDNCKAGGIRPYGCLPYNMQLFEACPVRHLAELSMLQILSALPHFLPEMKGPMVSLMRVLDRLVEHKGIEAEDGEDLGLAFLRDISNLAPVFMSVGNHEWYFTAEDEKFFTDQNITVLDNADVQVTIKDKKLRIGGLSTRYDLKWLKGYSQKNGAKILLCHHPEHYRYKIKGKMDSFDLVLSGHYHGGQWVTLVCMFRGLA